MRNIGEPNATGSDIDLAGGFRPLPYSIEIRYILASLFYVFAFAVCEVHVRIPL